MALSLASTLDCQVHAGQATFRMHFLGIDAGGTATRWALANSSGHIVSRGACEGMSGHVRDDVVAVKADAAIAAILAGVAPFLPLASLLVLLLLIAAPRRELDGVMIPVVLLTEAATMSRVDYLRGFKENVIMGHIIPAGTGFDYHRKAKLKPLVEVEEEPPAEVVAAAPEETLTT